MSTRSTATSQSLVTRSEALDASPNYREGQPTLPSHGLDPVPAIEGFRKRVLAGIEAYEGRLESELTVYRRQRAWRVMLFLRRAYTLLVRRGWKGRSSFVGTCLRILVGDGSELGAEELSFPNLARYLPEELYQPLSDQLASGRTPGSPRSDAKGLYDFFIFPVFEYDFRFQRPQQVAVELARRGHRVFWVSGTRVLSESVPNKYVAIALRENLWELQIRMHPQDLYGGALDDRDLDAVKAALEEVVDDFSIASACSLVQFPYWRRCALILRDLFGMRILYDCMDDWQGWTAEPRIGAFSLAEERQLAKECDVLLVTSAVFEQRYQRAGLAPLVVKNGSDCQFFSRGVSRGLLAQAHRPIIGYYGAIAEWFDVRLLYDVASLRPQYSFVLIGQAHSHEISRLAKLPNVLLLGEKHYRELPSYLRDFDVCLIPFVLNSVTKAVDPVKIYEYFSQGKPVVATPLPELEVLKDLLYFAETALEFAARIDAALAESDSTLCEKRLEFATQNTWAHRVNAIAKAVESHYPLVSILIVTYNSEEFISLCLDSIRRNTDYPNYEVIVVDNSSSGDTADIVREYLANDPRIHLYVSRSNLGFAAGNNEAARYCRGAYLLLLNPDTIVTHGWVHRLLRVFERESLAGIAVPLTNFSGNETKISCTYVDRRSMDEFARLRARTHRGQILEIPVAPLFCGLTPRTLWFDLGGLDERFNVGMFEDDDFSLRVHNAGFKVIAVEDAFVHHFGNGAFAKMVPEECLRVFEENQKRFQEKWNCRWTPHRLRPGVAPPAQDRRFTPSEFASTRPASPASATPLVLCRLYPDFTGVARGFNVQSDGRSAIVVDCRNATPGTSVSFGGQTLKTDFGSPSLVSAVVPDDLFANGGPREVHLVNDYGESNSVLFEVRS